MNFNLRRPCKHCPFRSDRNGFLDAARAREIATLDASFACHETIDHDDDGDGVVLPDSSHCAGFLIMREKLNKPSQMMRIAERLGLYDRRKLDMDAPVYDSVAEMVRCHRLTRCAKRGKVNAEGQHTTGRNDGR